MVRGPKHCSQSTLNRLNPCTPPPTHTHTHTAAVYAALLFLNVVVFSIFVSGTEGRSVSVKWEGVVCVCGGGGGGADITYSLLHK